MKKVYCLMFVIFQACSMGKVYAQEVECYENLAYKICFYRDSTYKLSLLPIDILPFIGWQSEDIISFGSYTSDEDKYILNTPDEIKYNSLGMNLIEDFLIDSTSNITIVLNSPFEREKEENKSLAAYDRPYFYMIEAVYKVENKRQDTVYGPFFTNTITIPCENSILESIFVKIYPFAQSNRLTPQFAQLKTQYRLSKIKSNYLVFEIPQFQTMYMYWLRFKNRILYRINDDTISFEGTESYLVKDFRSKVFPKESTEQKE